MASKRKKNTAETEGESSKASVSARIYCVA